MSRKGGLQSVWRDLIPADDMVKDSSEKGPPDAVDTPDFQGLNVNTETSIDDPNWSYNEFDGCKPQGFDSMAASYPMASTPASSMAAPAGSSMVGGQAAIGGGVHGFSGGGAERGGGTGGELGHDADLERQ